MAALAAAAAGLTVLVAPLADAAPTEAKCRTSVRGSVGTATCFNPDADTGCIQLHIECRRWWDPDIDGRAVEVGPAQVSTFPDRCWKDMQRVWVTHG
ncbi:hypothetical protein [Streptomyces zagrosensis]|uniref:Secreted protein n=1 Tax=Streptomyces zagrosensis TaxID=1042984 RepID=A0A7W9UXH4_9ACTN|nr:hypothetical protein [Streptomyces zagrosensis]MBB5933719.1 hypothetical protein [Streptomyces zagrosensis]